MAKRDQERKRIWEDRNSERKSKIWCQKVNEREKTKMVIITRQQEHEGRREKQLESKEERTDGMQVLRRSFFWKPQEAMPRQYIYFLFLLSCRSLCFNFLILYSNSMRWVGTIVITILTDKKS